MKLLLKNLADSEKFAGIMAHGILKAGDIVCAVAPMGAGKTTLCGAIGRALGFDTVASPTFTMLAEHEGEILSLRHFDLYRVSDYAEFLSLGFDESLESLVADNAFAYIEWPEILFQDTGENYGDSSFLMDASRSDSNPLKQIRIIPPFAQNAKLLYLSIPDGDAVAGRRNLFLDSSQWEGRNLELLAPFLS